MPVRIVNLANVEPTHLQGRDLTRLVTPQTVGSEQLTIAFMRCAPKGVTRPMHAHKNIEEVILILQGSGEAWVDGDKASFKQGDAVLFPANSKHEVRNTGDVDLLTYSVYAGITEPSDYITYTEDAFAD